MICDTIRELRERAGLSQSALAKRVGVTRSAVNAWEMGLSIPTTQYVAELAQLFDVLQKNRAISTGYGTVRGRGA